MYDEDEDREDDEARYGVPSVPGYRAPKIQSGDPSEFGWPPTLAMELALKLAPVRQICADHQISEERWNELRQHPAFVAEIGRAVEAVRVDGVGFKARASLQAVELLKTAWAMIHDVTNPPAVRARLIQATVQWAGLDASANSEAAQKAAVGAGFAINIHLG